MAQPRRASARRRRTCGRGGRRVAAAAAASAQLRSAAGGLGRAQATHSCGCCGWTALGTPQELLLWQAARRQCRLASSAGCCGRPSSLAATAEAGPLVQRNGWRHGARTSSRWPKSWGTVPARPGCAGRRPASVLGTTADGNAPHPGPAAGAMQCAGPAASALVSRRARQSFALRLMHPPSRPMPFPARLSTPRHKTISATAGKALHGIGMRGKREGRGAPRGAAQTRRVQGGEARKGGHRTEEGKRE